MAEILVVDDDASVTTALVRMLSEDGHHVTGVENATEGLALARERTPDAIILDLKMSSLGGLEFLRQLRTVPTLNRLPVGVVTGDYFVKAEVLSELESLGAVIRYKPLWMADVSSLTRRLLARAEAQSGPAGAPGR